MSKSLRVQEITKCFPRSDKPALERVSISLSDGLRLALYNSELTKEIVDSGRNRAEQFSMEKLANRYIDVYQRALSTAPSVPLAKGRQFFSGTLDGLKS